MAWKISWRESERSARSATAGIPCEVAAGVLPIGTSAAHASISGANITNNSRRTLATRVLTTWLIESQTQLVGHLIDILQHLIGSLHNLGIGLIGPLRDDHLDELVHHIDVGVFQHALLQ